MTHKNSNFVLWERTSSAMKLISGKASQAQEGNLGQKCQALQQNQPCPGYNSQQWPQRPWCHFWVWQQNLDLLPPGQLLTSHLLAGRGMISLCHVLTSKILKIIGSILIQSRKKLWKCLWEKRLFSSQMSQRLNIFSEIYKDFFFFLISASAQFTNKRSVTLCTKHGSGKKENQFQSFPLSCHRLLGIADSLRNIFTSIYTTYKWAALPAIHSHCCMSSVAVPRFANVCRAIYSVSSARGAALSSNDLVIFNPGTSFRWLTMWLHTCLCWHNHWDGTGTGTSNRRRGKAAKTKFIEICPQFFLCNNNNSYLS